MSVYETDLQIVSVQLRNLLEEEAVLTDKPAVAARAAEIL